MGKNEILEYSYKKGAAVLVKNSQNPGYFYMVREGLLEVASEIAMPDEEIGRFRPGDTFGLVSGLGSHPHLVTVVAKEDSRVIRIPVEKLNLFLKKRKAISLKMVSNYSRELRMWDEAIFGHSVLLEQGGPEKLLGQAETYLQNGQKNMASRALHFYCQWAQKQPGRHMAANLALAKTRLAGLPPFRDEPSGPAARLLKKDSVIFLENEPGADFYVVRSGAVKISRLIEGREYIVDILGPGEVFGEMAILEEKPRMASAVVAKDAEILRLVPATFYEEVGDVLLLKVFKGMAERIWFSLQRSQIDQIQEPVGRMYFFLALKLIARRNLGETEFHYDFNIEDLKKMAGVPDIKNEKIQVMLKDGSLRLLPDSIEITDEKNFFQKVAQYDRYFMRRMGLLQNY